MIHQIKSNKISKFNGSLRVDVFNFVGEDVGNVRVDSWRNIVDSKIMQIRLMMKELK